MLYQSLRWSDRKSSCCFDEIITAFALVFMHRYMVTVSSSSLDSVSLSSSTVLARLNNNTTLVARKLYDVEFRTLIVCSAQCVSEQICVFITFKSSVPKICSLYALGFTVYNVTGLSIYTFQEFKVNVQVCSIN